MSDTTKFHVSLNVSNLERSTSFYSVLFDLPPAKNLKDYAKFEVDNPPLVLALNPNRRMPGGPINHFGIRLADSERLVEVQRRFEMSGISTVRQDGVECCYAKQTKFWVADPDGTLWELYVLEEDIDHRGSDGIPKSPALANATSSCCGEGSSC